MSKKPKELLAAERAWKEADRVYKTAAAATDSAHKLFREAKDLKNQAAAWRLLSRARSAEHKASIAWYKAEHALQSIAFRLEYPNPCGGEFTPRSRKVAWSEDPEKRKRQRQHIAESIAEKKAIENPSPRKLPGQAVLLGEAVELEVISDNGRRRTFKGGGAAALLSDADGDALAIVRPSKMRPIDPKSGSADAKKTWRKWSGFTVDAALLLEVTDRPLKFSLGTAAVIRYRSDKWTGKALYYEHKFTSTDFHVWGDSASSPRAILITSFPPRRLVTARGIVG